MAPETFQLDPKVEELLRVVAADPESCLLRVQRPKVMPALFEPSAGVRPSFTGLSSAERELLRVGREEVAWLLREHCLYKLIVEPGPGAFSSRYRTPTEPGRPLDLSTIRVSVSDVRVSGLDGETSSALALLESAVSSTGPGEPGVVALALAAHRIVPSDRSRILVAQQYAYGDAPRSAVSILTQVLSASPDPQLAVAVWTNLGQAYGAVGDHVRAGAANARACQLEEARTTAWMYRLVCAVQSGNAQEVLTSSQGLERAEQVSRIYAESYVESLRVRRRRGLLVPTNHALHFSRQSGRALSGTARRIVDVFA